MGNEREDSNADDLSLSITSLALTMETGGRSWCNRAVPIGEILKVADSITTISLLILAVVALQRGIVVFQREVKELRDTRDRVIAERNKWQDIALRAMNLGERTISVIEDTQRERDQ